MRNLTLLLLFTFSTSTLAFGQEYLSPLNNPANKTLLKPEITKMQWFMLKDSLKIPIGTIETQIQKKRQKIYVITTVEMKQSPTKWVDSTIVKSTNFEPLYHSSFNQQRDMVLKFGKNITGYYLDKQTGIKTQIEEDTYKPFFDSNFYPQLIRLLPLKNGYSNTISIFDYNPSSQIGVITATIKNTEESSMDYNDKNIKVWKVKTTDEISSNSATSTFYIDKSTRKILKQEIDFGGRKMLMELIN